MLDVISSIPSSFLEGDFFFNLVMDASICGLSFYARICVIWPLALFRTFCLEIEYNWLYQNLM